MTSVIMVGVGLVIVAAVFIFNMAMRVFGRTLRACENEARGFLESKKQRAKAPRPVEMPIKNVN